MELYSQPPESTYGFRKCCEAVRAAVPIEVIARRYTELQPLGGKAWFTARCPFPDHPDHDPSFYIYPPGRFHCYGCDRGGDVIDLEFHCGSYNELWEAMIALKEEFDVQLPQRRAGWYAKQERQRPIRDELARRQIAVIQRRLWRWRFKPLVATIRDPEERAREARQGWDDAGALARMIYARLQGSE